MTISSALEIKQALIEAAQTALAGEKKLTVCNGHPGTIQTDDIVSFGRLSWVEEPGPISATKRIRDLVIQVYATVSVYRAGGPDKEAVAEARCLELADTIAEYVRVTDTTLGERAFWCFRTGYESDGSTDPELLAKGRLIEATVEFTARARIQTD